MNKLHFYITEEHLSDIILMTSFKPRTNTGFNGLTTDYTACIEFENQQSDCDVRLFSSAVLTVL